MAHQAHNIPWHIFAQHFHVEERRCERCVAGINPDLDHCPWYVLESNEKPDQNGQLLHFIKCFIRALREFSETARAQWPAKVGPLGGRSKDEPLIPNGEEVEAAYGQLYQPPNMDFDCWEFASGRKKAWALAKGPKSDWQGGKLRWPNPYQPETLGSLVTMLFDISERLPEVPFYPSTSFKAKLPERTTALEHLLKMAQDPSTDLGGQVWRGGGGFHPGGWHTVLMQTLWPYMAINIMATHPGLLESERWRKWSFFRNWHTWLGGLMPDPDFSCQKLPHQHVWFTFAENDFKRLEKGQWENIFDPKYGNHLQEYLKVCWRTLYHVDMIGVEAGVDMEWGGELKTRIEGITGHKFDHREVPMDSYGTQLRQTDEDAKKKAKAEEAAQQGRKGWVRDDASASVPVGELDWKGSGKRGGS